MPSMADVSIPIAVAAGLLSFLSPCVLPLVPPYLTYLAGSTLDELAEGARPQVRRRTLFAAMLFVLGFSTVFVALGAGASVLGGALRQHMQILSVVAGLAIMAMGLHFLGVLRIGLLYREARFQAGGSGSLLGAYVMGLAFAFGWTPCIGPVLGSILAVAGSGETLSRGALLLGAYSAGLGLPFLAAAFAMGPFIAFLRRFRAHLRTVERTMGAALVLTGIAFLTGWITTASFWLLETFPALGRLG